MVEKFIRFVMSDKSIWLIPAKVVAEDRATYYSKKYGEDYEKLIQETLEDDYEITDWATNNMDWADVKESAQCIGREEINYEEEWLSGDKTVIEKGLGS